MDYDELIEGITGLAPAAQFFMLVLIANNLREAVNQGHVSPAVLTQALDHLRMLVETDPGPRDSSPDWQATPLPLPES